MKTASAMRFVPRTTSWPAPNNGPVHVAEDVQAAQLISQPTLNHPPAPIPTDDGGRNTGEGGKTPAETLV